MTTRRRQARAIEATNRPAPRGGDERALADPAAPRWADPRKFAEAWVAAGFEKSRLRHVEHLGAGTAPGNRRNAYAVEWALRNGITLTDYPQLADWRRLRALGFVSRPSRT